MASATLASDGNSGGFRHGYLRKSNGRRFQPKVSMAQRLAWWPGAVPISLNLTEAQMNNATMLTETREGPVLVLTMNYPERRNALAMPMREAMTAALERAEADRELRAVVLTGAGGIFSSGGDISTMGAREIAAGRERFRVTHRVVRMMIESSKPIIAAVEGWAAG